MVIRERPIWVVREDGIKMSDLGKFIGGFGEQFVKTLESERKRKKEENEFNQDMAYKYRQQNLMMNIYQQQEDRMRESESREKEMQELGIRSQYQEISPEPNIPLLPIMMGGVAGGELNKPFDKALMPFEEGKFYAEKQAEAKMFDLYEDMGTESIGGKPMDRKRNKQTGKIEYFPHYEKPDKGSVTNIIMPEPEKWKDFGKLITDMKQTQVYDTKEEKVKELHPVERKQKWELAKNTAYSKLLPNAYNWYKKEFIDTRHEDANNEWFYKKLYIALRDDELTPEEVQDLKDFNVYREDLFGKNSIYGTVVEKGEKSE